ncbi:MAG: alpha/beta hydrolase [Geobacteraceae bacterium]|nr:alpha/beta hydrolase [Geobacteraceae bacterium]NTW80411.1 alpha/beta hydrolase [Geobacteraceae bacterium]
MFYMPIKLLTLVGIAYAGYALLAFVMQRQIIYPGRSIQVSGQPPAGIVPIEIATSSGSGAAWFMPPLRQKPGELRPLVIFFHGNGEVIDFLPEHVAGFRELGMGVLLVEYPGYGRSSGKPDEKSITATAVAAYDAVLKRDEVDPKRIVIFGRSLGGGAACALAARRPSAALILQSAFSSTRPFARSFLIPAFLVRDVFDNGAVVSAYRQPILLFHGSHDMIIPPQHSRELQRLAPHARLVEFPSGHNDFPPDWREFYRVIAVFLKDAGVLAQL